MFKEVCFSKSYKMMWLTKMGLGDQTTTGFNIKSMSEYFPGRQFVAKGNPARPTSNRFGVIANEPVFHFCDNAVDTLMWYWEVFSFFDDEGPIINFFEIKPLAKVFKNRAPDETMLYQCGTNSFEIVKRTNIQCVAQDACKEIENNHQKIIDRYPNYDMKDFILRIKRQAQK
ncbi:MAG: hypothetical protein IJ517_01080 [Alphaproteobacteria bacterium]|nr:hypothetical protein [Alphaproteobacteria bacterium]